MFSFYAKNKVGQKQDKKQKEFPKIMETLFINGIFYAIINPMTQRTSALEVYFYATNSGNEPVREWLKNLPKEDMRTIGFDIKTVQYGYPIGMPLTRVLHGTGGLEEVRCNISNGIARVIFYVEDNTMVLLHAFIKKTQETPKKELDVAIKRYKDLCKR